MIPTHVSHPSFRTIGRLLIALSLTVILLGMGYITITTAAPNATISLTVSPGASVAIKPTENEYISWIITPSVGQNPVRTEYVIINQDNDILYSETFTNGNGINEARIYTLPATYTVPAGLPFEQYTAKIDYYSAVGWEAEAKAVFFVSQDTGSLKIIKFNDLNLNGVRDANEPTMPGVEFNIQFPPPFSDTIFYTYTNASGEIFYQQLGTGSYTVTEIVPAGTIPTAGSARRAAIMKKDGITILNVGNATAPGGIEVLKFHDHNGNGQQDAGDAPLKDVHFDASSPCGQTATGDSDDNGSVSWSPLCVGTWSVTETVPTHYRPTTGATATTAVTSDVTSTVLFGNQGLGSLIVFKFEDKNGNGVQDAGEPAWSGVNVAYENEYGDSDACTTDDSGLCTFSDVPEGAYTVTETLPPSSAPIISDAFTATIVTGQTVTVTFPNRKLGILDVFKFEDKNGNGVQDAGEPAWPGVAVSYENNYGDSDVCTTGANGHCSFPDVPVGVYTVTETLPAFSEAVISETFTTTVAYDAAGAVIFPNRKLGNLRIIKFEDINGNGSREDNEPVWSGIAITYIDEYGDSDACTTDANGQCFFSRLPVGVYTITETPPADSAVVIGPVITTTLGYAITRTATFANRRLGGLSPHVFWDINGNGAQDWGEPDQPGFSVSYINDYGDSDTGQTDSNGDVLWPALPVGSYTTTLNLGNDCSATTDNPLTDEVQYIQTTYQIFGYRCMLYLPMMLRGWPPPTPTPTSTPTPTNTPTATPTPTPTATPTATPTPPPPYIYVPHPKSIGVDAQSNILYGASQNVNQLYVANAADDSVIAKIPVGERPYGVAVNSSTQKTYVANIDSNTVSVIDMNSNTVVKNIQFAANSNPLQVAVNTDANKIYVTLHGANQLAVIDGNSDTVIKMLPNLPGAFDVVVNRSDNQIYVSARDGHFVSIIDGANDAEVMKLYPGGETYAMAFDSVLRQLYIIIDPDGPLAQLDAPTGDIYLPLPNTIKQEEPNPNAIIIFEVKPNYDFGRRGYRLAGEAGPQGGVGIAANPTTGHFFVSNAADNTLSVFDGASLVTLATLAMDGDPGDVAVNPVTNRVYISNRTAYVMHMIEDAW